MVNNKPSIYEQEYVQEEVIKKKFTHLMKYKQIKIAAPIQDPHNEVKQLKKYLFLNFFQIKHELPPVINIYYNVF